MHDRIARREFLTRSAAAFAGLPLLGRSHESPDADSEHGVLIVCELQGGNDGLNTVVPIEDDAYHRARPTLRVTQSPLQLGDGFVLHPAMRGLHGLFREGELAVHHGVGYAPPNRSHFRSMDIWHSARPDVESPRHGWLGRAADALTAKGSPLPAVALGARELPLALRGKTGIAPAISSLSEFTLQGDPEAGGRMRGRTQGLQQELERARHRDPLDRLLAETAAKALDSAAAIKAAAARYRPAAVYPRTGVGRSFELAARVLAAPLGVRIVWLRQGGYDTHAGQERVHPRLLSELDAAVAAFAEDTKRHGSWKRCTMLVHSEFGRRLAENKSRGTDHGAAAPVLVLGGGVRGGLVGKAPSLTELDDGDPIATCDFRSVYARLLRSPLGLEPESILGASYSTSGASRRRRARI